MREHPISMLPRAELRTWIQQTVGRRADAFDREQRIPAELPAQLAALGILGAQIPGEHGGTPVDPLAFGYLCEAMGEASGSVLSLLTVHTIVSAAIARWGTPAQKGHWLPKLARGELVAAFALSEPQAGSDAGNIATVINREGDRYVVNGRKKWISFAQLAGLFLVIGKCEGKMVSLLVSRETPGLTVQPIQNMLGFRSAMLGELQFDDCVVSASHLIGSPDFGYAQVVGSVLDQGRYCIAWGSVGLAQACLDACLSHTEQRESFGQLLKNHQLVQKPIADMVTHVQAARLLCAEAARLRAVGDPGTLMATATAKYFAARIAESSATDAVQIHGAIGCSEDYPIQRYFRDAKIMNIIEGSTQIQQVLIAQHAYLR
jgi:glutaryl-CoA dehydrogenase (non-decarboxylating)